MPVETKPSWNEIRVRVKSPDAFDMLRSKTLPGIDGVRIIVGKLKSDLQGGMKTQAYRFNKDKGWDMSRVKDWLSKHNITAMAEGEGEIMDPEDAMEPEDEMEPEDGMCPECGMPNEECICESCIECGMKKKKCACASKEIDEACGTKKKKFALWTTAEVNNLPDSSFAVISTGGTKDNEGKTVPRTLRHLPYKDAQGNIDLPHLRNALARLPQTNISSDEMAKAKQVLQAAAKKMNVGNYTEKNFSELEMEIFATGKWNGDKFEDKHLEEIMTSYNKIGSQMKPYLKLGHNDEQKLAKQSGFFKDGMPALGWIDSLKKQGNKLVATFKDVPQVIADLVKKKAYRRVSCELYENYEREGKKYPLVLKAVALLGGDTPAVTTLQDVVAMYAESTEPFKIVEFSEDFESIIESRNENLKGSEHRMTEEELKAAEAKFAEEKALLEKKYEEAKAIADKHTEIVSMFEGIEDMKKAVLDFQTKQKEVAAKEQQYNETLNKVRRDEIKQYVEGLIKENKILPFQQKMVEEILFSIPEGGTELEFSQADLYGLKEKMTLGETIRALFNSNPDMGMLKEFTSQDKVTQDPDSLRVELEKKYMDEHKVDYGTAQKEISKVRPELYNIK